MRPARSAAPARPRRSLKLSYNDRASFGPNLNRTMTFRISKAAARTAIVHYRHAMHTLEILHHTRYGYSSPVALGSHRLMFRPRDSHDLRLLDTGLSIEPAAQVRWVHDAFGNSIALAQFEGTTELLEIASTIRLQHFGLPLELPPIEDYARTLPFSYPAEEAPDLAATLNATIRTPTP